MREPIVPQLVAEEYLSWEARQTGRFELHRGFLVAFAGGLFVHDRLAFNLRSMLESAFPEPCRSFGSDVKIKLDRDLFYYADAGVICEPPADDAAFIERPCIVAEVLSPSTRTYDLIDKRTNYRAMASVEAYVVVHTTQRRVEVDERRGGRWHTSAFDAGEAVLLGRPFPLDALYARTALV